MSKKQKKQKKVVDPATEVAARPRKNLLQMKNLGWLLGGIYAFIMLLVAFAYHKIGDYGVETDFFWSYVPQAKSFLDGHLIIDKYRGPLYPMALGLFHLILGDYFKTGIVLAVLSAGLVLYFSYEIVKKLFSPLVALVTVLLLAVNTTFNLYSYSAGTDMFFMMLVSAALYFIFKSREYKLTNLLLSGLFAGLAYITRYNGIFIPVSVIAGILFINIFRTAWKTRLIATAGFLAVFIVVITPWGIYTQQKKGKAFFNQNYQNVAYEYLAKGEMSWDEFWYQGNRDKYSSLTQVILNEPAAFFKKMVSNSFEHLGRDLGSLMGWHISIFSILGLLLLFYKPPSKEQWLYFLVNFLFFGVLLLVFYNERFSMFMIPFYGVFATSFLFEENKFLKKSIVGNRAVTVIIAGILVIWTFTKSYSYNSENINSGDKNLVKVAREFKKNVPESQQKGRIMSRKAHIAYYLGLDKKYIPPAKNYYEQVALLWKNKVDYVYYGIWEQGMGIDFLKDPNKTPPDFEFLTYASAKNKIIRQVQDAKTPYKIETAKITQPAFLYAVKKDSLRSGIMAAGDLFLDKNTQLNKQQLKDIRVMAVVPYFAYYTGTTAVDFPKTNLDSLYSILEQQQVDYLFYGPYEASTRYQTGSLIFPENAPEWLVPVEHVNPESRFPIVLYKFKPLN